MYKIAVFASGKGSNAQQLIHYFRHHSSIRIHLIVSNNTQAGVLEIAKSENIPAMIIEKEQFFRGNAYLDELQARNIDFIILAGFLWKVPASLIAAYPKKIINIHPALLPNYGGKGMYGRHVHEAVLQAKEVQSGITIHYVDEWYDHGSIIFQAKCLVDGKDTPESLAEKIHQLEHWHYPAVVEQLLMKNKQKG